MKKKYLRYGSNCKFNVESASCNATQKISFSLPAQRRVIIYCYCGGQDAAVPTDGCKENGFCNNKLVKDMQHLASHIEGPKLPHEVESALSLPVDILSVTFPVQSAVQINTQISVVL